MKNGLKRKVIASVSGSSKVHAYVANFAGVARPYSSGRAREEGQDTSCIHKEPNPSSRERLSVSDEGGERDAFLAGQSSTILGKYFPGIVSGTRSCINNN
jgi:hypothetical protein